MKTFTLRLTDNEAAALETIAFFKGVSKNKALEEMIACEYELIDAAAVYGNEVIYCTPPEELAAFMGSEKVSTAQTREELMDAIKYLDYGIEKHSGTEKITKEDLMKSKEEALKSFLELS